MGLFEKSLEYLGKGYYTEELKALGKRIGRSKKLVEGGFPTVETFTPKASGKMPEQLRGVVTGKKFRKEGTPPTPLDWDYYMEQRHKILPEEESTDIVERWAREKGKAPYSAEQAAKEKKERGPAFAETFELPKKPTDVVEEWQQSRESIQDFPTPDPRGSYIRGSWKVNPEGETIAARKRSASQISKSEVGIPLSRGSTISRGGKSMGRDYQPGEPQDFRSSLASGGTFGVWEEPPKIKKKVDITDQQWQRYLQRIADRTPSGTATRSKTSIGPGGIEQTQQVPLTQGSEAAVQAVGELAPEQTRLFSRLREPYVEEGVKRHKNYDLPYTEAIEKYTADLREMGGPGKLEAFNQYLPPADVMSISPEGAATYERRKFQPVGERVQKAISNLKAALPAIERRGSKITEPAQASDLVKKSMLADEMWKFIGGKRSIEGKMWERIASSAPGVRKASYKGGKAVKAIDARDYFGRVALKWMQNKKSVRDIEAKMLEETWAKFVGE